MVRADWGVAGMLPGRCDGRGNRAAGPGWFLGVRTGDPLERTHGHSDKAMQLGRGAGTIHCLSFVL